MIVEIIGFFVVGIITCLVCHPGGGYSGGSRGDIDGIQFDTESAINPTAVLSVARDSLAGVQSGSL